MIWAVVPMKAFARGKSRLRGSFDDEERERLARDMFRHVLAITRSAPELAGTLVITDGDDVAQLAADEGAIPMRDPSAEGTPRGLARVVDAALLELEVRGVSQALVLMADLPHLQCADVTAVLGELTKHDVVIVPDLAESFTNALALPLSRGFRTCFGAAGSAQRHLAHARELGLSTRTLHNARIAFDVDTPEAAGANVLPNREQNT